jgi:hypothetical protein
MTTPIRIEALMQQVTCSVSLQADCKQGVSLQSCLLTGMKKFCGCILAIDAWQFYPVNTQK